MAEQWEPTAEETRVLTLVVIVLAPLSLIAIIIGNVSGNWWPAAAYFAVLAVVVVGVTVWAARTRHQGLVATARQIIRSPNPKRRS